MSLDDACASKERAIEVDQHPVNGEDFDPTLLDYTLAMTPWERMLANDDALRFGELLRKAVREYNAEPH